MVVGLAGELDLYNAHTLRETLLECCSEAPERLVVDLSEVKFIDSTALGVLIEARTRMPNRRGFLLAAPGLETRRALDSSGATPTRSRRRRSESRRATCCSCREAARTASWLSRSPRRDIAPAPRSST